MDPVCLRSPPCYLGRAQRLCAPIKSVRELWLDDNAATDWNPTQHGAPARRDRRLGMSTCSDGWHQLGRDGSPTYFAFGTRLRDRYGTYVYLVGSAPRREAASPIWCYGDHGVPWTCVTCGVVVDRTVAG